MPLLNRAIEMQEEVSRWRRHLHENPELMFDVHETAKFVADKLRSFGVDEVATGIGRTGVVGIIRGRHGEGQTVGLRSDMDALPLHEITGKPYASKTPGKMHACGHDGHTAMLLGAAQYLAETRNFKGSVAVIFQPAEEGGGGGREMVKEGMMERFSISEVYGMHNTPGLPVGQFAIRKGPIMAATDEFNITIEGRGGHAAQPHRTIDPVVIGAQLVNALQTIVSRGTDPLDSVVLSVTKFHAGDAHNIIPQKAELAGTVRTLRSEMRDFAEKRLREVAEGVATALGAVAGIDYDRNYPVTFNHDQETEFAARTAQSVAGSNAVNLEVAPMMAGEDFSYMLEARPGAFMFIGNGESASLHNPAYDFNDDAIPHGISYWVQLAESALPAAS
ncbi:M20 aminoacylase family protein [Phyllobacterium myrsinacearum]|uniref:Amidohydrolase n=1 Tax=Phyllobacterium myrsinacearum TaxID=28101 RepID=A0A2S9JK50_9HYPH|nr:M20 aminoacylase family protein [Phyllobacterium myrsinacearum]PRD53486.1 amidohydrolase [Phyllobacterium myrsinacearum]PWV86939.1 hippurate hydrolase [Phyllobacterium myrsinacearum]RZV07943.1 hippurate hydrolase [Phyllobacterium myrsinacearum]